MSSMVTIRIPTPFFERILTDDGVIRQFVSDADLLSIVSAVAGGHA